MSKPGTALKRWRDSRKLSQQDAAEMLDPPATQGAWAAWELGKKPPSLTNALGLERLTGIDAEEWVARSRRPRRHASAVQSVRKASNG